MDPGVRETALAYAAERYPLADLVVVGGSAAGERRPRSDIDLLVVGPAAMFAGGADEAAHTDRWRDEVIEVFAGTAEAFTRHLQTGIVRLRPVSAFLLVDGVTVLDRGRSDDLRSRTAQALAEGPHLAPGALDQRRYEVTCTLDDLLDASDAAEAAVLAGFLFQRLAEFVLLASGRWIASGRWLLRRLHDLDAPFADRLGTALAARDVVELERLTVSALAPHGGRLLEGHVRGR